MHLILQVATLPPVVDRQELTLPPLSLFPELQLEIFLLIPMQKFVTEMMDSQLETAQLHKEQIRVPVKMMELAT
jgi:hypothetical protein